MRGRAIPDRHTSFLKRLLRFWAERWQLGDNWLFDVARETLGLWRASPASARELVWQHPTLRFQRPGVQEDRRLAIVQEYHPDQESPDEFRARVGTVVELDLGRFLATQKALQMGVGWPAQVMMKRQKHGGF